MTTETTTRLEIEAPTRAEYLRLRETLERMGVYSAQRETLYQSCHIHVESAEDGGRHYIAHFKELMAMDGREVNITEEDILRRNRIFGLLAEWNMIRPVDTTTLELVKMIDAADKSLVYVLPHARKGEVRQETKYIKYAVKTAAGEINYNIK